MEPEKNLALLPDSLGTLHPFPCSVSPLSFPGDCESIQPITASNWYSQGYGFSCGHVWMYLKERRICGVLHVIWNLINCSTGGDNNNNSIFIIRIRGQLIHILFLKFLYYPKKTFRTKNILYFGKHTVDSK